MKPVFPILASAAFLLPLAAAPAIFPGADENTPSLAHYFTWINNTNEGATAAQTRANLEFFQWLHDEYGMILDIYAFDAGVIDAPKYYGSPDTRKFEEQFPEGFGPLAEQAKGFGGRLGVWLGPDGFGDTPAEENARIDFLTSLCRDHRFHLFKMDAVCSQLREEKQDAFIRLMESCRKHSPDLIVLNHRLALGKADAPRHHLSLGRRGNLHRCPHDQPHARSAQPRRGPRIADCRPNSSASPRITASASRPASISGRTT